MPNNSIKSFGFDIYATSLDHLPTHHQTLVNTINQYSYCVAQNDFEFKNALQKSDVLLPDGIAIVAAVKFLNKIKIKKIAGADIHEYCLKKLNKNHGRCFYLGSSEITLNKIEHRLKLEYPNITVQTFSPPYKAIFSEQENEEMLTKVNNFKPDVLFVGMTAPKQEKWATEHKSKIDAQLICTIGAVFDFYAGTVKRPSKIWINLGLEWLGRLLKEPKRMWRRYLYYGPVFILDILKLKFSK
ncbi:N-acetylglucosaminyldiphospho-UDP N-acetyl-beta-D-mannosaminyltransferase [Pedobacter psychrophilus]|uniref:N-acetylglucosaminyldiphospho-UDP N-acetyl-beta-D-mannosaminyltransferase n=1 Tax=Pedobacter psychrophilus TaxID=1826909 RepID=A0A179DLX1_9SPHI|nr:WecB/TagA/CpsF family glycosyltransferase [Pedobacter psychrophilus]OAQ42046.1 N-acetylglucosaminyldiphospho-UDP N-acetyl-beta-D-mannosaminyltransferase [Pedobacter psychrophilus]